MRNYPVAALASGFSARDIFLSVLVTVPFGLLMLVSYRHVRTDLTEPTLSQRETLASLAAVTVRERLERLVDLSRSLAERPNVREHVGAGRWEEAGGFLKGVPAEFPIVDRILVVDPAGTVRADTPALGGVRGKNLSDKDWFQGVSREWKPYVSEVFLRVAEPRLYVVAVACPIFSKENKVAGILVVQVRAEAVASWASEVSVGPGGFVHIVDREGQGIAPPGERSEGRFLRSAESPVVGFLRQGKQGIEAFVDPKDGRRWTAAFQWVPPFGWGVVVAQPEADLFASRDRMLRKMAVLYAAVLLLLFLFTFLGLRYNSTLEAALRELAAVNKFLGVQKQALDRFAVVAETDPAGRISYANDQFCAISGYTKEELVGKDHRQIANSGCHPKDFWKEMRDVIGRGKIWRGDVRNRTKHGEFYWLDTTIVPFMDKDGKPEKYLALRVVVTERKRAEESLQERSAQLEAANKELEAFSYSVSHDLRAPLRAIDGFAAVLAEDCAPRLDGEGRRLLSVIQGNARQMGQLIDDLLAFSRVGRQSMLMIGVDMASLARKAAEELLAGERGRKVALSVGELPPATGDRAMLRQVLVNLLANALKFTRGRAEAVIEVGGKAGDGEAEYWVRDNGAGFDMRYAGKLFQVFQRLHSTREFEGTGVGLALVHRIVTRHGGRVWAEGKVGEGACFRWALPLAEG